MADHLKDLLVERVGQEFVGRIEIRARLMRLLNDTTPLVLHIYGIAGIGKSSLLDIFTIQVREAGAVVIRLDCRILEPSRRGFLAALAAAIGEKSLTIGGVAKRLASISGRVIVILDTYENFRLMDTWLRQDLIPELAANTRVILSGREPPVAAWQSTFGWHRLFEAIRLEPLLDDEVVELLSKRGLQISTIHRINSFCAGHPLALQLATAAVIEHPNLHFREIASLHVIDELTRLYLADVPDPATRQILYAASVVRRSSPSLLHAMLPEIAPQDAYERLHRLPFVSEASDGLVIHELVQNAIVDALRSRDIVNYRHYRQLAWRQLRADLQKVKKQDLWRFAADMLYFIEEPALREAFFPSSLQPYAVEPSRPDDGAAIVAISREHECQEAAKALSGLWDEVPHAFYVVRDRDMQVVGFYILFDPQNVPISLFEHDPLASQWWQHLQSSPLPKSQRALFVRRWLSTEFGELPSPVQAACWLDMKAHYMEMRSKLRRVYSCAVDAHIFAPVLQRLGFSLLADQETYIGEQCFQTALLDFGPDLMSGWLSRLAGMEVGAHETDILDIAGRELNIDGERVPLSPLEFGVLHYLRSRENVAVSRSELLNEVWGYEYEGGSNVVDVKIRSLRSKMGELGSQIETVSAFGYRFRRL